jgi:hypothetical protein
MLEENCCITFMDKNLGHQHRGCVPGENRSNWNNDLSHKRRRECTIMSMSHLCSRVLLQNLKVAQLVKKFRTFLELKGSLPCTQEPTNGSYPKADQSSLYPVSCIQFNIVLPCIPRQDVTFYSLAVCLDALLFVKIKRRIQEPRPL